MSGINNSRFMASGPNIRDYPGQHAVELTGIDAGQTWDKKEKFIPQFMVHGSTNDELQGKIDAADGKPKSLPDVMIMNNFPEYFYTDVRKFLGGVLEVDPSDDDFDWATAKEEAEAGKFDGQLLLADVVETGKTFTKGKRAGKNICHVEYSPPPTDEAEAVA